ncbi:ATP-binding protein [Hyalangium rubrum]|uniref:histidine kinase n=1 Tax=Hyalangium rubrum TaxID=3103134 RepID=A0ABU5GXM0_9BACT|nr:ATP-binding protein [Hyalangium sp. s54d21]MDY7225938.1 ATP-binding protein [Hyalangium sp. s54d21]
MADEWGSGLRRSESLAGEAAPSYRERPRMLADVRGTSDIEADALRYRMLARHLRTVVFQLDPLGRFTLLGASWNELTGLKTAAVLGTPLVEALHPVDREQISMLLRTLTTRTQDSFRHEVRVLSRAGTCWVELFAQASPASPGEVLGIMTDITERRRALEAVITRERGLAAVVEVQRRLLAHEPEDEPYQNLLEPLSRAAGAGRVYVLEARREERGHLLVTRRAEWCAVGISSLLHRAEQKELPLEELLRSDHALALSVGQPVQFLAAECPSPLREHLEAQQTRAVLLLPLKVHGEVFGFLGFDNCVESRVWEQGTVDLLVGAAGALSLSLEQRTTDALRARTEATLRSTEAGLHLLIEGFPDPVLMHADEQVLYVNPAMVRYLGHEGPDSLVRQPVLAVVRGEDHSAMLRHLTEAREELAARAQEMTLLRQDGQEVVADLVTLGVTFEGRPVMLTFARDFTERKQMQAQLMLSDRMVSMGTQAAGIAHELNNPLSYVIANLEFVHGEMRAGPADAERVAEWREVLGDAREGSERVRQIVRQLKAFSRVDEERREPVDLHQVLDSVAQMANNEVRHRARLVKDYGTLPYIVGNDGKLFQVFLNLVINAAHAIPEGKVDGNEIRIVTREDARGWAVVEVRDSGSGIRPEHLGRIFEPFFTTKPHGVGTGLGLPICHALVRAHGGDISVESTLGKGTTFRVVLPPAEEEAESGSAECVPVSSGAGKRVLIIDDEPSVAAALGRMLEGHRVEIAHGGVQALKLLGSEQGYDLIFCDLMMPERTGMDVFEEIIARQPELAQRFIFMTGGGFTPRSREFIASGKYRVLDKPFDKGDVYRLMLEVLSLGRTAPSAG